MERKDKKYFTELFLKLKDYLTKLSYCSPLFSDLKSEEEESLDFVVSSLLLLRKLSELSGNKDGIPELTNKFRDGLPKKSESETVKKILNSLMKSQKELSIEEEEELEDEVNYVYIWVLNSYQLDLKTTSLEDVKKKYGDLVAEEFSATLEEEQENLKSNSKEKKRSSDSFKGRSSKTKSEKEWAGYSVYRNLFNTERWSFGSGKLDRDEDSFEYIVTRTQALERLEREVRKGRIYIYSTKPVRNLKWKQTLSFLCFAGAIVSFVAFFKSIVSMNGSNQNSWGSPTLFALMSFIFFLLTRKENNRFRENENFKYCFSKKIFYYYFFLSLFFVFGHSAGNGKGYSDFFSSGDSFQIALFAPLLFLVVSSILIFLIGFFFLNPKKNKVLIENLLNKYSHPPYLNN
ncbi:Conserved hypothetical protein [Mycoplasma suis str. Illinois]|uniref:Uncharacterized protein n=1 Tax=Mycoplasma suis (strain Illinois) TaxID=768700 RepID=F0QRD0_MYCSL|nr:Conserved hypothetical protein [Mycoplasma suis str. Illinois]